MKKRKLSHEPQWELDSKIELSRRSVREVHLNCKDNKYSFSVGDFCGYLSRNPEITKLTISNLKLNNELASVLATVLPTIKQLTLHFVEISDKGIPSLLAYNPTTELAFNYCRITDQQAADLAGKTSLAGLSILEGKLHNMSEKGLNPLINNKKLNTFRLQLYSIPEAVLEVLQKELFKNKLPLTHLNLTTYCEMDYRNGTLTSLALYYNQIGDDGARVLKDNPTITNLSLLGNDITAQGAIDLASSKVITHLALSHNKIGDIGASAFQENSTITDLNLFNCGITSEGAKTLACNKKITSLRLDRNNIGDQGAAYFRDNHTITRLKLDECFIGKQGAIGLSYNKTITSLSLNNNPIGNQGAAAFEDNRFITNLSLSRCGIGEEGAIAVAKNGHITILNISGNAIGDPGAAAFRDNTSLIELTVMECHVTFLGAIELAKNKVIKNLYLNDNQIGDTGAAAFRDNTSLTTLNLNHNGITGTGLIALALNQSISHCFVWEDNPQKLWTPSAVYFLWANFSLLRVFNSVLLEDINHLSNSHTSLLKKMELRNRLMQKEYAIKTKAEIVKCLGIKDLAELVYGYAKDEFPYHYNFFNTVPGRKIVTDLCQKMPELKNRFDFLS